MLFRNIKSIIAFSVMFFVLVWYQSNVGLVEWVWELSFLFIVVFFFNKLEKDRWNSPMKWFGPGLLFVGTFDDWFNFICRYLSVQILFLADSALEDFLSSILSISSSSSNLLCNCLYVLVYFFVYVLVYFFVFLWCPFTLLFHFLTLRGSFFFSLLSLSKVSSIYLSKKQLLVLLLYFIYFLTDLYYFLPSNLGALLFFYFFLIYFTCFVCLYPLMYYCSDTWYYYFCYLIFILTL